MEDHQFTVHLELDGDPGPWTYHRTLPYRSGFDPTLRPAVDAVKALIRAVEALE